MKIQSLIALAAGVLIGAGAASAATVTVLDGAYVPAPLDAPDAIEGSVIVGLVGSVPGAGRDPWEGTPFAGITPYISVNGQSAATYTMSATQEIMFRWGAPDNFNRLELLSGGEIVDVIGGPNPGPGEFAPRDDLPGSSNVRVTADVLFDSVRYFSAVNSFEFGQIQAAAVPLPAAGLLLLGGLGALGATARRRRG